MMHYTLFGESHGPAVGVLLTDVPPGLPVDEVFIREQLLRRMGQGGLTTARQEKEEVRFLSGAYQGRTTGDPLAAVMCAPMHSPWWCATARVPLPCATTAT